MDKTRMVVSPPMGPGFSIEEAEMADSMSIAFSAFDETGEDYAIFTLHKKDGEVQATKTIKVY
jgi:hypothetical protein